MWSGRVPDSLPLLISWLDSSLREAKTKVYDRGCHEYTLGELNSQAILLELLKTLLLDYASVRHR